MKFTGGKRELYYMEISDRDNVKTERVVTPKPQENTDDWNRKHAKAYEMLVVGMEQKL